MEGFPECVMKIDKVQMNLGVAAAKSANMHLGSGYKASVSDFETAAKQVSFTGGLGNVTKRGWLFLRNLSTTMANPSEIINAVIQAVGTGIIAPLVILGSPGKGDKNDKDKKKLQALRQPISAFFQLGFQVPMTILINRGIDRLVYVKHAPLFNDDVLGSLIPDKNYIRRKITKEDYEKALKEFDKTPAMRDELAAKIREEYEAVGLENVSYEEISKKVDKRKKDFLKDRIADKKHKEELTKKIDELRGKFINDDTLLINGKEVKITGEKLLTSEYKDLLARCKFDENFANIRKDAKLTWFDKVVEALGFSNKKLNKMAADMEELAKEKGLKLLKEDNPTLLTDKEQMLNRFVRNCEEASKELLKAKKRWISLGVNIFMVAASCYALNWAHPRINALIKRKQAEKAQRLQGVTDTQKVEVK